jgi:hypothetical protein
MRESGPLQFESSGPSEGTANSILSAQAVALRQLKVLAAVAAPPVCCMRASTLAGLRRFASLGLRFAKMDWAEHTEEFTVAHGMTETRDWQRNRDMWVRVLEKQTREGVDVWKRRIGNARLGDERSLRAWLTCQGVTGYAQSLLVMERFGYPDFVLASADQLIDQQYADRPHLRPIYDAIVSTAMQCGGVIIQARRTLVSLVTLRRPFARVLPTTKTRVDLGLRLDRQRPGGRLQPSTMGPCASKSA